MNENVVAEEQEMVTEFPAVNDYKAAGISTGVVPVSQPEEKPEEKPAERVPLHKAEEKPAPAERPVIEKVAIDFGWLPEEKYKPRPDSDGKKRPFISAEEFVRNIRQVNKLEENERLHKEIKEIKKTVGEYKVFTDKAHATELAKVRKELEEQRSDAIRDMDEPLVDEIDKKINDVDGEAAKANGATNADAAKAEDQEALTAWQEKNTWYDDDAQLAMYADRYAENARAKYPDKPFNEILVTVDEKMQKHMPKTEEPATGTPPKKEGHKLNAPPVETGASNASGDGSHANTMTYSDLPDIAKTMCDRFVATTPGFTREQYLKDYQSQKSGK